MGKKAMTQQEIASVWVERGDQEYVRCNYIDACACFEKALVLFPSLKDVGRRIGLALLGMQDYKRATAALEEAVIAEPDNVLAYTHLGSAYECCGDDNSAEAMFQAAHRIEPTNVDVLLKLANFYDRKDSPGLARLFFKKAARADPNNASALINCGISLLNQECFSDAACYLEDALKLKTLEPDAREEILCRLVDVYTALGDAKNLRKIRSLQLEDLDEDRQENM